MCVGLIWAVEGLDIENQGFPEKKEFYLKT